MSRTKEMPRTLQERRQATRKGFATYRFLKRHVLNGVAYAKGETRGFDKWAGAMLVRKGIAEEVEVAEKPKNASDGSIRVHALAKDLGTDSASVIEFASARFGGEFAPMSKLSAEQSAEIRAAVEAERGE